MAEQMRSVLLEQEAETLPQTLTLLHYSTINRKISTIRAEKLLVIPKQPRAILCTEHALWHFAVPDVGARAGF